MNEPLPIHGRDGRRFAEPFVQRRSEATKPAAERPALPPPARPAPA